MAAASQATLGSIGVIAEGKRHLEAVDRILGQKKNGLKKVKFLQSGLTFGEEL